jgi:spoIIIJ-associated protein
MTDPHEFAGKTIEEAIELAAQALDADAESVEYKLLETPKKFFFMGGSKEYRIRVLKFKPAAGGPGVTTPPEPATPTPAPKPVVEREREPEPVDDIVEQPAETIREAAPEPAPPAREERRRESDDHDEEVDRIVDLVDEFLDRWGMDLDMDVSASSDRLELDFFGEDEDYLLETKGAGLLSLQLILGKMLYKQGLIKRKLQVDCQGYRSRRENELRQIATRMADKVKKSGEDTVLNPLNPYERRIVHLALVEDRDVTTESLGEGYMKKIKVRRI